MEDDDDLISFCSDMAYDFERRADDSEALRSCLLRTEAARQKASDESCTLRERVRELEEERDAAFAERDEWADAIRTVALGAIPSPHAARRAIARLREMQLKSESTLASERSRREKAEALLRKVRGRVVYCGLPDCHETCSDGASLARDEIDDYLNEDPKP